MNDDGDGGDAEPEGARDSGRDGDGEGRTRGMAAESKGAKATSSAADWSCRESPTSSDPGHIIGSGSSFSEIAGSRGQMAMISTGKGSTVHTLTLWEGEEHVKQVPSRRAIQHRRTLVRTVVGRKAVSQPDAAWPR